MCLKYYRMRSFVDLTRHLAVEESWNEPFKGSLDQLLFDCLEDYAVQEVEDAPLLYGHSVAIINSSGTGKTRTVDRLGLKVPLVPVNLASSSATSQLLRASFLSPMTKASPQPFRHRIAVYGTGWINSRGVTRRTTEQANQRYISICRPCCMASSSLR